MATVPRSRFAARLAEEVLRAGPAAPPPLVGVWSSAGSTNDLAKEAAKSAGSALACRGVFVAERQTAGRGRHGRSWVSPPGGLYLSLLTPLPAAGPGILPLVAGVALGEAVRRATGEDAVVRWPNDLDLDGRKVGGALVEAGFVRGPTGLAVAGFGINCGPVATPPDETDPGRPAPGWLPPGVDRARLAGALVAAFRAAFRLACESSEKVFERWNRLSPTSSGQPCRVRLDDGSELAGRTDGLGPDGGLAVRLASGERRVIFASETIRMVHERAPEPDFFGAVERRFTKLRGGALCLAPGDWQVASGWRDRGIPLPVVLSAIAGVFERLPGPLPRMPLRRCDPAVEAAFRAHRRRRSGSASWSPGLRSGARQRRQAAPEPPGGPVTADR